jgi:hypothetical protein
VIRNGHARHDNPPLHRHLVVIDHTVEFDFGLSLLVGGI